MVFRQYPGVAMRHQNKAMLYDVFKRRKKAPGATCLYVN
jgi:hypothetical protein